ncbi:MAG TPA: acyl-CoA desaturase [Actinomycetota bacterium]|nr:acyl-CoA desaturase [Actinomycetota bacterium]
MAHVAAQHAAPVPGVRKLDDKRVRLQRRLVLVVTVVPFLGFVGAVFVMWGRGLSAADAVIALLFYLFTGLGVTVGFHRHFTHQSFDTPRALRGLLAIAGSMAVQGPIITWVADHRRHHAFSDKEGDPHSPHLDDGPGIRGVAKGLWHAHMGWLFSDEQSSARRWAPDLLKDSMIVKIDRLFPLWMLLTFALPPLIGFAVTGTLAGALTAGLWGSLVRVFMLHHVTWSINSICHFYGNRPFGGDDFSTNNWMLSIVSFGESWHNNHHAFPSSAVHGVGRFQIDISGAFISGLEKVGLATNVKRVSTKQLAAKGG